MDEKELEANFGIPEISEISTNVVIEDKKSTKLFLSKINTISDVYHISEFINLLEILVKTDGIKSEINIKLTDKTRVGFLYIIKSHPEFFSDFEKTIVLILADNKIDIDDLPHLTKLIIQLYKIIHTLKQIKYTDDEKLNVCSTIIKFIIQVMVKEKKINMCDLSEEDFLVKIEEFIDSCIGLIEISKILKGTTCGCFGYK